jgi:hypothetical protein
LNQRKFAESASSAFYFNWLNGYRLRFSLEQTCTLRQAQGAASTSSGRGFELECASAAHPEPVEGCKALPHGDESLYALLRKVLQRTRIARICTRC